MSKSLDKITHGLITEPFQIYQLTDHEISQLGTMSMQDLLIYYPDESIRVLKPHLHKLDQFNIKNVLANRIKFIGYFRDEILELNAHYVWYILISKPYTISFFKHMLDKLSSNQITSLLMRDATTIAYLRPFLHKLTGQQIDIVLNRAPKLVRYFKH